MPSKHSILRYQPILAILLTFSIVAKATPPIEQNSESPYLIEYLRSYAKLYGYVKYFHPSDEASAIDWDKFAVYGVSQIQSASSPSELKSVLETLFLPIAPTAKIRYNGTQANSGAESIEWDKSNGDKVVFWQYLGIDHGHPHAPYQSSRIYRKVNSDGTLGNPAQFDEELTQNQPSPLFNSYPKPNTISEKSLGNSLIARIPLVLRVLNGETVRPVDSPDIEPLIAKLDEIAVKATADLDKEVRLANVIIAWNVFQHFYPYFDVVDVDWDNVLTKALNKAYRDQSASEFLITLQWMVAQLDDGHGNVTHSSIKENGWLPFSLDKVAGEIVITTVIENSGSPSPFKRGDVVLSIDGQPIKSLVEGKKQYISGSPQWKNYVALTKTGFDALESEADVVIRRNGEQHSIVVKRDHYSRSELDSSNPIEEVHQDIYYVDLRKTTMPAINAKIHKLSSAKGVIFDVRGYPQLSTIGVLQHLTDRNLQSAHWKIPQVLYPDQVDLVGYDSMGRWNIPPKQPKFQGKIAFLTNARAISMAESLLGIVEYYGLGEIIGQQTAGANGNSNPFSLIGGYTIGWTGMRVIKHDGSQHHLIGIHPSIYTDRTIEGIRAGRDEYLETAIDWIRSSESGN